MKYSLAKQIAILRLIIGFLGEQKHDRWWSGNYISRSSDAYLIPIYPRTRLLAQYHGICEEALLIHDKYIGVGNTYHLYRLPNPIERVVAEHIRDHVADSIQTGDLSNQDAALRILIELTDVVVEKLEGPVLVGSFQDTELKNLLDTCAAHYLKAFQEGYRCFPYMGQAE